MSMSVRNRVNERVKVECGQIGILSFDENHRWCVILGQMDKRGHAVVQVGKSNLVLCSEGMSDYDLVHVVELVPVLIAKNISQTSQMEKGVTFYVINDRLLILVHHFKFDVQILSNLIYLRAINDTNWFCPCAIS